jgi:hypothetical protein
MLMLDPAAIEAPLIAIGYGDACGHCRAQYPQRHHARRCKPAWTSGGGSGMSVRVLRFRVYLDQLGGIDGEPATRAGPATSAKTTATRTLRVPPAASIVSPPRLTVSTAAPAVAGGRDVTEPAPASSPQEAASALEAETLVLRHRIAQLTDTVNRLQSD